MTKLNTSFQKFALGVLAVILIGGGVSLMTLLGPIVTHVHSTILPNYSLVVSLVVGWGIVLDLALQFFIIYRMIRLVVDSWKILNEIEAQQSDSQ